MIEKVNVMNISRAQADGQHQLYVKTKEETIPQIYEKIGQLVGQLNSVKAAMAKEAKAAAEIRAGLKELSLRNLIVNSNSLTRKKSRPSKRRLVRKQGISFRKAKK